MGKERHPFTSSRVAGVLAVTALLTACGGPVPLDGSDAGPLPAEATLPEESASDDSDHSGDTGTDDTGTDDTNSGETNSGETNSGETNSGDTNSGETNSGDTNSGDTGTGDTGTGDTGTDDTDTGDTGTDATNSGDANTGDTGAPEPPPPSGEEPPPPVTPPAPETGGGLGEAWPEAGANMSSWVYADGAGGLGYRLTDSGDRIPDFSYAGYGGGGVPFPTAPVMQTLDPNPSGDDTARIQAAIDAVAALPLGNNGMRGTVLLKKGRYRIWGQLRIASSGIILRGEGRSETGTVLRAKGTDRRSLILLEGQGNPKEVAGTRRDLTDAYVPVGTHSIHVDDASGYAVGQRVIIERDSTAEWLDYIGMDSCETIGTPYDTSDVDERTCLEVPWVVGGRNLEFDRVITAINGNQITVDAPLTMSFEPRFGGGWIYQFTYPGRIERVGVENLRGESDYSGAEDEDHSWTFIELSRIEDAWVDRIVARYFAYAAVMVGRWSRRITVEDSRCLDPISQITGARRYSFKIERATQVLVQRCDTREGRHDFVLGQLTVGPNVFLQGTSVDTHDDVGPHAGWSPGALFDGIVTDHNLNIRHRGNMGTNHGWVSANSVVWNSEAVQMKIESPPGAQNWCIGCVASTRSGNGVWESAQNHVWPESLYLAQLRRRLGDQALTAIGAAE